MPLRIEKLFLDINGRSTLRLANSLEDPTRIDPGPLWIEGDKFAVQIYPVEVVGSAVRTLTIPADYTCTLTAKRLDEQNDVELFSHALVPEQRQGGHGAFIGVVDLSNQDITDTLALDDADLASGVRLRVQALIAAPDSSEILRPSFIVILRSKID